jgi:monoterpene epsilon-lactone hydrolase
MPSGNARIAKLLCRINKILYYRSFSPLKMQRYMLSDILPSFAPKVSGVSYEPFEISGIPAEWIIPEDADNDHVLFHIHGGGYVIGSIRSHRKMVARFARAARCRALLFDYRLAPEHPFPAALEDALTSYRWLLAQGYEPGKIAIAGDSAGGGLAIATLIALRDAGEPLPAAGMLLSPWTDLTGTGETLKTVGWRDPVLNPKLGVKWARCYLGDADPLNPLISPIYADCTGLPPLLIHVGTKEMLLDDSRVFAERAQSHGVPVELDIWDGMFHVWHAGAPALREGTEAIKKLAAFFEENVKEKVDAVA